MLMRCCPIPASACGNCDDEHCDDDKHCCDGVAGNGATPSPTADLQAVFHSSRSSSYIYAQRKRVSKADNLKADVAVISRHLQLMYHVG